MKTFISRDTLNKFISIIKRDLSHKVDYTNELSEDDVRQLWNDVTGDQIPNILSLQHNHDELYYRKDEVLQLLESNVMHKDKFYKYYKYGLSDHFENANGNTSWMRAYYWNPGQNADKTIDLSRVLPAPFNDKSKCIIISASCFDGTCWFHGVPITTFEEHQVQVRIDNNSHPQHCAISIILMRTDI